MDLLFGRLHPLLVHFPIALILLAAAMEVVRIKWDRPTLAVLVSLLLATGAAGSLAASVTGWVFAHDYYPPPSEQWMLERHRWLGVTTTVLAAIAAAAACRWSETRTGKERWLRSGLIWSAAIAVTVTAHFGALMVWGADFFDVIAP